ncbi:MAG: ammonium transporter [Anaerolineae bacterium]
MPVKKTLIVMLILPALGRLLAAPPALAQEASPGAGDAVAGFLPAALVMFLPLGLLLLAASAQPARRAPVAAITLLLAWSVAALAYFAVGFAFNFGGIAQVLPHPDFAGLYWEWYPLDQSVEVEVARLWGVIALQGWALADVAAKEAVLLLFISHVSLVGVAAMIPAAALVRRGQAGAALLMALLAGALVYPVAGNWLWGGGWLFNLGASLDLGHGLVDFGGASVIFLNGAALALAALATFRPPVDAPEAEVATAPADAPGGEDAALPEPVAMPAAHLPILSTLGGGLLLLGWLGLASGVHAPTAANFSPAQAATAGVLAGLGAALTAAAYSWFTTREFNPLMAGRGLAAGVVVAAAGAPFVDVWVTVLAGLLTGLLLPWLIYLFEEKLPLRDQTAALATFGVSSLLGLLLVGLAATGQAGQGWNSVGLPPDAAGAGISGLWFGGASGQLQAQLLGAGVIFTWALLVGLAAMQLFRAVALRRAAPVADVASVPEENPEQEFRQ